MNTSQVQIEESWKALLQEEFDKPYFEGIRQFLHNEKKAGKVIFPPGQQIFQAFSLTPVDQLKVVILGQDPYHNPGEAMGLCFSVPEGVKVPPSLNNIYKELRNDLNCEIPNHGNLTAWARQGVLLLNAFLTVEQNKPLSHSKIGWQLFTDAVISHISEKLEGKVFLLWGNFAKAKAALINPERHLVLTSPHPSPLAGNGFYNNHHFSKANDYLKQQGSSGIDWQIKNK
ncbi:MAG: uracil-DNA glycosylase [Saprospiraceae bacterium]|nr:uracil-DNA glycosylase [Saprospiraceae bacterium]MBK8849937.1 uracil-DNA glycosylase [Saprospiraceae bacterium]MBK9686926.1 uracil-DNA glycosylase [Saprospiraceae bacterium]